MNYIIGPRGSGRSSYILRQREKTGGIIYTFSNVAAQELKKKASVLGYPDDKIEAIFFDKNNWRGVSFPQGEIVYFDNFEQIFKEMFGEYVGYAKGWEYIKPVAAITTNDDTVKLDPAIPTLFDFQRKELLEDK